MYGACSVPICWFWLSKSLFSSQTNSLGFKPHTGHGHNIQEGASVKQGQITGCIIRGGVFLGPAAVCGECSEEQRTCFWCFAQYLSLDYLILIPWMFK